MYFRTQSELVVSSWTGSIELHKFRTVVEFRCAVPHNIAYCIILPDDENKANGGLALGGAVVNLK